MGSYGSIVGTLEYADKFYEWLQDAPMKDEDEKQWHIDPVIKVKDKK